MSSTHRHGTTGKDAAAGDTDARISDLQKRVASLEAAAAPAPTTTLDITFASMDPRLVPVYVPGDPGYGLDSDFLGNTSQVTVANGIATIRAERKTTPSGRPYASACIGTKGTWGQRFGIIEARIRYPKGQGAWPAFWMLEAGKNVSPPEIDIFEAYPATPGAGGGSGVNVAVISNHYAGGSPQYVAWDAGSDLTADWHVWRCEWRADAIRVWVDGVLRATHAGHVPTVPLYPILTLAMGAGGYRVDGTTPAVLTMDVDYLRAWA
jgi:beta-glucanase (GH16 family)